MHGSHAVCEDELLEKKYLQLLKVVFTEYILPLQL